MPENIHVLAAPPVRNRRHHLAGAALLAANALRHRVRGYRTPRPRPPADAEAAFRYDRAVVSGWLAHLTRYLHGPVPLPDAAALEIGPGTDLGTGLILLGEGLERYRAIDAHPLLRQAPRGLHAFLADRVAAQTGCEPDRLRRAVDLLGSGDPEAPLGYVHDPRLDLAAFGPASFDFFFSHAVFEHIEDVEALIEGCSHTARPGALLVSEIDLQTHTRWIRDVDPLNIYRYTDAWYRACSFSGIPNRVRPDQYMEALVKRGWTDIRFFPRRVLPPDYVRAVEPTLAPRFRGDLEHLGWLSVVLCARYGDGGLP
jgi:SAM-dependent methyltransferase